MRFHQTFPSVPAVALRFLPVPTFAILLMFLICLTICLTGCTPAAETPRMPLPTTPEMIYIPTGTFLRAEMCSVPDYAAKPEIIKHRRRDTTQGDSLEFRYPKRDTLLMKPHGGGGFWMSRYEITQAQYEHIMGSNPSHFKGGARPVESITVNDAEEFCKRLSERHGIRYLLPTNGQWEYACRAGTSTDCYTGNLTVHPDDYTAHDPILEKAAWYAANANDHTHTVGLKQPNAFGLYDMHGNVAEWMGGMDKRRSSMMGGSWRQAASGVCSQSMITVEEHFSDAARVSRTNYTGFRIVSSEPPPRQIQK